MVDYRKPALSGIDDPITSGVVANESGIYRQLPKSSGGSDDTPAIEWHATPFMSDWVQQGRVDKKQSDDHLLQKEFIEGGSGGGGGGGVDPQTAINTASIATNTADIATLQASDSLIAGDISALQAEDAAQQAVDADHETRISTLESGGGGGTDPQTAINTADIATNAAGISALQADSHVDDDVESVTGTAVDITDPRNPVVNLQTALQTSYDNSDSGLAATDVKGGLDEIAATSKTKAEYLPLLSDLAALTDVKDDGQAIVIDGVVERGLGGGVFVKDSSLAPGDADGFIVVEAASGDIYRRQFSDKLNVLWFGATPIRTGFSPSVPTVDNCSAAFRACIEYVYSKRHGDITTSNPLGSHTIFIPYGTYFTNQPQSMLSDAEAIRTQGLIFEGEAATRIYYASSATAIAADASNSLISFDDSYLNVTFKNLMIEMGNPFDDCVAISSNGGTQNVVFERVEWRGNHNKTVKVYGGSNTGSEIGFNNCGIVGGAQVDAFLEVSATDQNLNYWFNNFRFWANRGTWIRALAGGHIKLNDCDMSGHSPVAESYLFELIGGPSTARGSAVFVADNLRCEHKTEFSKLINCDWGHGVVAFNSLDQSSQAVEVPNTDAMAKFALGNSIGPSVVFSGGLMGKHEYSYGTNSWEKNHNIKYDSITHWNLDSPDDFIILNTPVSNQNSKPNILFTNNCRGAFSREHLWDQDFGRWKHRAIISENKATFKSPDARLPVVGIDSLSCILPQDSQPLRFEMRVPAGSTGSTAAYTYELIDGNGTVRATVSGSNLSSGINQEVVLNYKINANVLDRTFTLRSPDVTANVVRGYAAIVYI